MMPMSAVPSVAVPMACMSVIKCMRCHVFAIHPPSPTLTVMTQRACMMANVLPNVMPIWCSFQLLSFIFSYLFLLFGMTSVYVHQKMMPKMNAASAVYTSIQILMFQNPPIPPIIVYTIVVPPCWFVLVCVGLYNTI